jgi:hypothetical protein
LLEERQHNCIAIKEARIQEKQQQKKAAEIAKMACQQLQQDLQQSKQTKQHPKKKKTSQKVQIIEILAEKKDLTNQKISVSTTYCSHAIQLPERFKK